MLRLPVLLSEGCVLQREQCRIWGWCTPGVNVRVCFRTQADEMLLYQETTAQDGSFEMQITPPQAGGPYRMQVSNALGEQITIEEVYVGDVFVCAGQSNMELPMSRVRTRFPEEFWNGGAPEVHEYKVAEHYEFDGPLKDHEKASWQSCTKDALADVSAVAYFFGKELARLYGIPIGILNLSLGGTPIEAWMSREALAPWPDRLQIAERYRDESYCRGVTEQNERREREWQDEIKRQERNGRQNGGKNGTWKTAVLPGYLSEWGLEEFCGCVWLQKTFCISEERAGKKALLRLGTLTDSDTVWINGTLVGETPYCYPPRRYPIPQGVLKAGENKIRIRLVCRSGAGRVTAGKPLDVIWQDVCGGETAETCGKEPPVCLDGAWEYQVRAVCGPAPEQVFISWMPTGLFYGMAAPCLPCMVRGVVWYQGESNDRCPKDYAALLRAMIGDWRAHWKQETLPFLILQLPNCELDIAPGEAWPLIREAQWQAASLDDVAVTVNLDLGEDNDLHPLDKRNVAQRAVLAARVLIYREDIAFQGPQVCGWFRTANGICLRFDQPLAQMEIPTGLFELAGADGSYYPVRARIMGECVAVRAREGEEPVWARYAWSRAPGEVMHGTDGLCAAPFRIKLIADKQEDGAC